MLILENVINEAKYGNRFGKVISTAQLNESYIEFMELKEDLANDFLVQDFRLLSEASEEKKDTESKGFLATVKEKIIAFWKKICEYAKKAYDWIKAKIKAAIDWIKGLFGKSGASSSEADKKAKEENITFKGKVKASVIQNLALELRKIVDEAKKLDFSDAETRKEITAKFESADEKIAEFQKALKAKNSDKKNAALKKEENTEVITYMHVQSYQKAALNVEGLIGTVEAVVNSLEAKAKKELNKKDVTEATKSAIQYYQKMASNILSFARELQSDATEGLNAATQAYGKAIAKAAKGGKDNKHFSQKIEKPKAEEPAAAS